MSTIFFESTYQQNLFCFSKFLKSLRIKYYYKNILLKLKIIFYFSKMILEKGQICKRLVSEYIKPGSLM